MENPNLAETRPTAAEPTPPSATDVDRTQVSRPAPEAASVPAGPTQPALVQQLMDSSNAETQPVAAAAGDPSLPAPEAPRRRSTWLLFAILGLFSLLLIAALSAFGGYNAGLNQRTNAAETQKANVLQVQYNLGLNDIAAERYEIARQRYEYIIQIDPAFPGALDRLVEINVKLRSTATPTLAPTRTATPTITPTAATPLPNYSDQETLYNQAQQMMAGADWSGAVDTLLSLRKKDSLYNAIQVDGMLYVSLRYRGVEKISRYADLEGGMYDLALAERFGPLDVEATNWRYWASLYVTGASYWQVDWPKVVDYFGLLNTIAPSITDGSGWSARDRYRIGLTRYGDWLAARGDWCLAKEQYALALGLAGNATLAPTATYAVGQCSTPTSVPATSLPTPTATNTGEATPTTPSIEATPTPTSPPPAETPTPTPTEPAPTETPTATATP
jgi:tetratricopeptide (TPR) repeat protein